MLSTLIQALDEYIGNKLDLQPKGLTYLLVNTKTQPVVYSTTGNSGGLSLENEITYHRVLSETGISTEQGLTGCSELMTKTYSMRYVAVFDNNILSSGENNAYTSDKIANTLANTLQSSSLKLLRNGLKATDISIEVSNFNTNSRDIFNTEMAGHPFDNFPKNYSIVSVDYSIVILADTKCLKDFTCGEVADKSLLQIVIDESSCAQILNAIENSTPLDKRDCIRKGISNGFSYTFNFNDPSRLFQSVDIDFEGTIDTIVDSSNIFSYQFRIAGVDYEVPFQVNIGDVLELEITKGAIDTAFLTVEASEFDSQSTTLTTTNDARLNARGVRAILDPEVGVTRNFQLETGNLDTNSGSTTINGGSIAPSFDIDDNEMYIRLHLASGDQTVRIVAINSPTQIVVDTLPNTTESNISFSLGYISSWADQSGLGNDFIQVTASRQPRYKFSQSGGYHYVQFGSQLVGGETRSLMAINFLWNDDFTIGGVFLSLETFLTTSNAIWFGNTNGTAFTWFAEFANPSPYVAYAGINTPITAGSVFTNVDPSTFRTEYKFLALSSETSFNGTLYTATNKLRLNSTNINNTSFNGLKPPNSAALELGSRGDTVTPATILCRAFIVCANQLTDDEHDEVYNYYRTILGIS